MTKEKAIERATKRALKDTAKLIIVEKDILTGEWGTKDSNNCCPDNIIVDLVVTSQENIDNYWIQKKLNIQDGRFKDTIIFIWKEML